MNKLSRKEFKDLLLEWNKNFIVEKKIDSSLVDFKGLRDDQKTFVQQVPIDLNLLAIGNFIVQSNKHYNDNLFSFIFIEAMKNSRSLIKNYSGSLIFEKSASSDIIKVLNYIFKHITKDNNFELKYYDENYDEIKIESIKKDIFESISSLENKINNFVKDNTGLMIYFPRMFDFQENMAAGSINNIFDIQEENYWKSNLQWELMHDVFHYFEAIFTEENFNPYEEVLQLINSDRKISDIIRNIKVDHSSGGLTKSGIRMSSSLGDPDNFASVAHTIRSLENSEQGANLFLEKCRKTSIEIEEKEVKYLLEIFYKIHSCYDFIEDFLRDKIIIQLPHE